MNRLTLLVPLAVLACTPPSEDGIDETDGHTDGTDETDAEETDVEETDVEETDESNDTDIAEVEITEASGRSRTSQEFYTLDWTFSPFPLVAGETTLTIKTLGSSLEVIPWMSIHGHGASGNKIESKVSGTWEATWTYTMAGPWEVTITVDGAMGEDVVIFNTEVAEPDAN